MIESTGIRRAAKIHDMVSAIHRVTVSGDITELDELDDEQIKMWLIAVKAQPGEEAWQYAQQRGVVL